MAPGSAPSIAAAALLAGLGAAVVLGPGGWRDQGPVRDRPGITSPASPPWVAEVAACLARPDVGAGGFRVEGRLRGERSYQPLAVGAWPVAVREGAGVLVAAEGDLPERCRASVLCRAEEVRVARCPP